MTSSLSLFSLRSLRTMAAFLLAALPCIAFAQWRVVAVTPEVEAMRFDTILDAHSYMKDYRIEEEEGNGVQWK